MTASRFAMAFLLIAGPGLLVRAQSAADKIANIRATYAATNSRIEAGLAGDRTLGLHHAACTIGGERDGQQWSAVGTMRRTEEFYFDGEPGVGDGKIRDAKKSIRKIVTAYAGAADLRSSSEYYLDQAGHLVFVLSTHRDAEGKTVERREYFLRDTLVRVVIDGQVTDSGFSREHLRRAAETLAEAKRLQGRFVTLFTN